MASTLNAFFDRYRRAFERRELDKLLDMVAIPCMVATGHGPSTIGDRDTMRNRLEAQVTRHAEAGVADAAFEIVAHRRLAASLLQAEVRWTFHDDAGEILTTFDLMYLMHSSEHGWRISLVAPVENIP